MVVGRQPLRIDQSTMACITAFSKSRLSWAVRLLLDQDDPGELFFRSAQKCVPNAPSQPKLPADVRRLAAIGSIDHFDGQAEAHARSVPSGRTGVEIAHVVRGHQVDRARAEQPRPFNSPPFTSICANCM